MSTRKPNILVVSDPMVAPGYLPRVRYLCDYLARKGYGVTLLTEDGKPLTFTHAYPIQTIRMYHGGTLEWFAKAIWTLLTDWYNRAFANDSPLGAAARIARRLNIPLVCDIRDLEEQVNDSHYQYQHQSRLLMPFRGFYRTIHRRRRNAVLRQANAITTVSPWHAEFIQTITKHRVPVTVVYNGFDEQVFYPSSTPTPVFKISYIGSLFAWQKAGLEKMQKIIAEWSLPITLDIHTPKQSPIDHTRLGEAIRESSIMLVLTSTETHGMLTTKFYEALGCNKPVLCVPSDKGALADLIAYTKAGIATEDEEEIKAFIQGQYKQWKEKGYTHQQSVHREEFTREAQCRQTEEIIKTILS